MDFNLMLFHAILNDGYSRIPAHVRYYLANAGSDEYNLAFEALLALAED
jgi:hypothetical protein